MQASREERDDLTQITGIRKLRQTWLEERFDARTYDDVAALEAGDIVAQLKADDKPYSRSEVELWLQEAAELAAKRAQRSIGSTGGSSESEVGNSPAKGPNPGKAKTPRAQGEQWKPVATFVVQFQMRRTKDGTIEHQTEVNDDTDKIRKVWPGVEGEQIGRWMVKQAGDKLHREIQEAPAAEPEAEPATEAALPERLSVTVTDLRLYQPAGMKLTLASGKNGRPHGGVIRAGQPVRVEADFELDERAAAVIGEREIPYRVQFYTHNRLTGDKAHLGDAKPGVLVGGKARYSAMLREGTLPAGTYRLQVVVIAESESVVPGYLELPMLRAA